MFLREGFSKRLQQNESNPIVTRSAISDLRNTSAGSTFILVEEWFIWRPHTSCEDETPACLAASLFEETKRTVSEQKLSKSVWLVICPVNDRRQLWLCCLFSTTHIPRRNEWLRYTRGKTCKPEIDVYRSPCLTTNTFHAVAPCSWGCA